MNLSMSSLASNTSVPTHAPLMGDIKFLKAVIFLRCLKLDDAPVQPLSLVNLTKDYSENKAEDSPSKLR